MKVIMTEKRARLRNDRIGESSSCCKLRSGAAGPIKRRPEEAAAAEKEVFVSILTADT